MTVEGDRMFSLVGMKALVTGASGGIGSAIAAALAAQGATVALSGTRMDALTAVASGLPNDPKIIQCNLANSEEVEALVPQAISLLGGLDILVNNAGITRDGLAMRMKDEDWQAVLQVNLESTFRLCRAALKPMMKARFGRIINITSVVGVTGNPGQANYAAAKAGLIGMSKALGQEIATRGITVNCVAPGFITSPMTDALSEDQKASLSGKIPMARLGEGAEVAAGVAYLASREAAYVTGQTLHINGGMVMI
jgi:3-oxoacyl-[acyl-carrier protein] reductase